MNTPMIKCYPARAEQDEKITSDQFRLLCTLCYMAGEDNLIWRSNQKMAEELGKNERVLRRHLSDLEQAGYIQKIGRQNERSDLQTSNFMRIIWHQGFPQITFEEAQKIYESRAKNPQPCREIKLTTLEEAQKIYESRAKNPQPCEETDLTTSVDKSVDNHANTVGTLSTTPVGTLSTYEFNTGKFITDKKITQKNVDKKPVDKPKGNFKKVLKWDDEKSPQEQERAWRDTVMGCGEYEKQVKIVAPTWCFKWLLDRFIESWRLSGYGKIKYPISAYVRFCANWYERNGVAN